MFLFLVGHTIGTFFPPITPSDKEILLFEEMKSLSVPIFGVTRTHWDFYYGLHLYLWLNLVLIVVWIWLLGNISKIHPKIVKAFAYPLTIIIAGIGVVSWIYFFPPPAIFAFMATACLVWAINLLGKTS